LVEHRSFESDSSRAEPMHVCSNGRIVRCCRLEVIVAERHRCCSVGTERTQFPHLLQEAVTRTTHPPQIHESAKFGEPRGQQLLGPPKQLRQRRERGQQIALLVCTPTTLASYNLLSTLTRFLTRNFGAQDAAPTMQRGGRSWRECLIRKCRSARGTCQTPLCPSGPSTRSQS
jgi:hypothetical protein